MRRETAIRLSITIDRELAQWLDQYAYREHVTKSIVIEELVEALRALESEEECEARAVTAWNRRAEG
ncbi:MAG TPA: hypothetical protein DCG33_03210 [Prevotellaceae bacterium]|nr:hypothetical protein [Prevotellaceae bacterium]